MGRASARRKRANYEPGATCRGLETGFGEPSGLINPVEFDKIMPPAVQRPLTMITGCRGCTAVFPAMAAF
jgi:hypothetical protein